MLCALLFFSFACSGLAQEITTPSPVSFYGMIGTNSSRFIDQLSSQLPYQGIGGFMLGGGLQKGKHHVKNEFNLSFAYSNARYPETSNEDVTELYQLKGTYSHSWIRQNPNKRWGWSVGWAARSEALYLVYPFLLGNNANPYSMDLMAIDGRMGCVKHFRKSALSLMFSSNFASWNFRPQSFNGVSPNRFWSESKPTSLHNHRYFNLGTSYWYQLKKGAKIALSYQWHFRTNRSTLKDLSFAQHALEFKYFFKKKP